MKVINIHYLVTVFHRKLIACLDVYKSNYYYSFQQFKLMSDKWLAMTREDEKWCTFLPVKTISNKSISSACVLEISVFHTL